jgi:hypothetical protein
MIGNVTVLSARIEIDVLCVDGLGAIISIRYDRVTMAVAVLHATCQSAEEANYGSRRVSFKRKSTVYPGSTTTVTARRCPVRTP